MSALAPLSIETRSISPARPRCCLFPDGDGLALFLLTEFICSIFLVGKEGVGHASALVPASHTCVVGAGDVIVTAAYVRLCAAGTVVFTPAYGSKGTTGKVFVTTAYARPCAVHRSYRHHR